MRWIVILAAIGCGSGGDPTDDTDAVETADTTDSVDTVETADTTADTTEPADTTETAETAETVDTPNQLPDDPCFADTPSVHVGSGEFSFEPLTPGQDLEMIYGAQGGWHIWGGVRGENVVQNTIMEFTIRDVETGVLVHGSQLNVALRQLVAGPWACEGTYAGVLGVLTVAELTGNPAALPPTALCGREVELSMTLRAPVAERPIIDVDTIRVIAQPDAAHGGHCAVPTPIPEPPPVDTEPPPAETDSPAPLPEPTP